MPGALDPNGSAACRHSPGFRPRAQPARFRALERDALAFGGHACPYLDRRSRGGADGQPQARRIAVCGVDPAALCTKLDFWRRGRRGKRDLLGSLRNPFSHPLRADPDCCGDRAGSRRRRAAACEHVRRARLDRRSFSPAAMLGILSALKERQISSLAAWSSPDLSPWTGMTAGVLESESWYKAS